MTHQLLSPFRTTALLVGALAFAAAPQAQTVFEDFDDIDVMDIATFSGGAADIGIGVGTTTGLDGTDESALSVGINPGAGGGFAGFVVPGEDGTTDIDDAEFITFYVRATSNGNSVQPANLPLSLEVNLQEDSDETGDFENGVDDEFRAAYQIQPGTDYQFVEIPLSSFFDNNSAGPDADGSNDGFDFENLVQIVFAIGNLQGPEFAFAIDEIVFTEESQIEIADAEEFDFFDREDFSNIVTFAGGAADIGIGVGPTAGVDGDNNTALSIGINPGAGGGFAGFVVPSGDAPADISEADYLVFSFRPTTVQEANLPLTLEVNLQENADGMGDYDPAADDEFQAVYRIEETGDGYVDVAIPLSSFADDNSVNAGTNDGFDFENLEQVVFAFGGLQGPEFAIAIDNLGFATAAMGGTSTAGLPEAFDTAPAVFPNPTVGGATLAFDLAAASDVSVDVIDLLGRRVAALESGVRPVGAVRLAIPTADLPAGVYVVRVRTDEGTATTRMTVIR